MCDRFVDSSLAYQGHARGLGIDEVYSINEFAIENMMPAMTLYFDVAPEIGLERINKNKGREVNRLDMEKLEFHQKVREGYMIIAERFPDRIAQIDASKELAAVYKQAEAKIKELLNS